MTVHHHGHHFYYQQNGAAPGARAREEDKAFPTTGNALLVAYFLFLIFKLKHVSYLCIKHFWRQVAETKGSQLKPEGAWHRNRMGSYRTESPGTSQASVQAGTRKSQARPLSASLRVLAPVSDHPMHLLSPSSSQRTENDDCGRFRNVPGEKK